MRRILLQCAIILVIVTLAGEAARLWLVLDIVNHFRPFSAALAAVVLAGALIFRLHGTAIAAALSLAAQGAGMAPGLAQPPLAKGDTPAITLMTWNAARQWGDGSALRAAIEAHRIDVIALQEMHVPGRAVLDAALASVLPHCEHHDEYSICARWPLTRVEAQHARMDGAIALRPAFLAASVSPPPETAPALVIVTTHISNPVDAVSHVAQTREMAAMVAPLASPRTIVAGDFNATPWSISMRILETMPGLRRLTSVASWPAAVPHRLQPALMPFLAIDHVFAGKDIGLVEARPGPALGSDHRPVLVRFALSPVSSGAPAR